MNSDLAIGLHIVGFLTARGGEPLTSDILAQTYGTSPVVVRRILSRLKQAGLVETKRGAGGGSVLAHDPARINLRQVYEAVARNPELLRRHPGEADGEADGVADVLADYINELCGEAEEALMRRLEKVSVKQMDAIVKPRICEILRRRN